MKRVLIVISGGAVQSVTKPKGIELEIRDYDIDVADVLSEDEMLRKNEDGDWYQYMFWDENETEG